MTLLDNIIDDLTTDSRSLSSTLRKAKILASKLQLPELKRWIELESNGYPNEIGVPHYRRQKGVNLGTFFGAFGSGVKNQVLPTYNLPEPVKSFAENMIFLQSTGELEGMLQLQGNQQMKWPAEFVILARSVILIEGMELADAHKPIPKYTVQGILENVKNRLLDFVVDMQENDINDGTIESGHFDRIRVRNIFHTHIYGNRNAVNVGEEINNTRNEIRKGNLRSLVDYLRSEGIDNADLKDLEKAINSQGDSAKGELCHKVSAWIGNMVKKAVAGTSKIAAERAPEILVGALTKFFGV